MPVGRKPRPPISPCSLLIVCATRRQLGHWMSKNSITTTWPLKLESGVVFPDGSTMVNSGESRRTGGAATAGKPSARRMAKLAISRMRMNCPPSVSVNSDLFPPVGDSCHFGLRDLHGILRARSARRHADEHPRDDEAVEHLHSDRICVTRKAEIPRPVESVLQRLVLVERVRPRVVLEPDDEVGKRFLVNWKVAACRLFVGGPRVVDQVGQELLGPLLVLRKVPDHRTIGGGRKREDARRPEQLRVELDLAGNFRFLLLGPAQKVDRIDRAGSLARRHGSHIPAGVPSEVIWRSRILAHRLDLS